MANKRPRSGDDVAFQAFMRQVREKILKHGWMVQGVFPHEGETGAPFAYTIGLTDAGLPELLIAGPMHPQALQSLLNHAALLHVEKELQPGDEVGDIANVVFRVREAGPDAPVQQAHNYYRDPDRTLGRVRVLQLVWPDVNGFYPGDLLWSGAPDSQPLY